MMKKTFLRIWMATVVAMGSIAGLVAQVAPTEISIVTVTNAKDTIDNTNIIWKEIEKRTNTKLSITFVPVSNYPDKLAVTLASGNLPDLLFLDSPQNPLALKVMSQGAFWDLSKLYKQYKELASYPEDSWLNTKGLDGKNYVVPRPRPLIGQIQTIAFRQDWLDKLKLKLPETPDELYKTLKAFVNDDPDGNGVKDTDGLVGSLSNDGVTVGPFNTVFTMFTGNALGSGYLELKNGKLVPAFTNPDFKAALTYLTKLYSEGLIHRDFAIMKQQQMRDAAMSGRVGAVLEGLPGATVVTNGLQKVVPTGSFTPVTYLKTVQGAKFNFKGTGVVGAYAISKKVDAEKVKKILTFLNAMSSDEIWELANWGFKDVHYAKDGVMYVALEQSLKDKVSQTYMGQIASQAEKYFYAYNAPGSTKVRAEMNAKKIDEIMAGNYSLPDPTAGLVVESYNKISKELNKKLTDQMLKTILGGEKLDAWDAFAATLAGDATFKASLVDLNVAYTLKLAND